jgi:hypothetical protein
MPRKCGSLKNDPRSQEVSDLTPVEFQITNEQKIYHTPTVEHILEQAAPLLLAGDGQAA